MISGEPRRFKCYICVLYRCLGSLFRSKGSSSSGLDAEVVAVQNGFVKSRLAYCGGKFYNPSVRTISVFRSILPQNLVWSKLDSEYRNDTDIVFLFESVLKVKLPRNKDLYSWVVRSPERSLSKMFAGNI